ncbi:hypothetical protein FHS83_000901 [Rhizomicrobium palustre]|uniref:Uncharacterized protein n=1 Tax=Rhizomicrobium palustre TaxID=189966 RepID=A0A846MW57_9PROT|nr:hypothetical protein [Rhizomicrobium palustre]NIK87583.1 hypothetical protein [Rhizomicrobium palustre]
MTMKHTGQCGGEAATFLGIPQDTFPLKSGQPKAFHYIAGSGKGLDWAAALSLPQYYAMPG